MRIRFIVLVVSFLSLMSMDATACTVCGGGAGGYYMGLMPLFAKNYVGMRVRTSAFTTHAYGDPAFYDYTKQRDAFTTAELVGRYYPTRKWQITAFVPYQFHTQSALGKTHATSGLGDALLFGNYNVINNLADTSGPAFRHSLWVGAGLKMATGHFERQTVQDVNAGKPTFLLGTGSWDPMVMASYMVRRYRTGISLDLTARYATLNRDDYAFGNRLTANLSLFTIRQKVGWGYMPNAGLYAEATGRDYNKTHFVNQTGGNLLAAQAGVDVMVRQWTVGVLGQTPLAQRLADGLQKAEPRFLVQVGCAF
jgi:hypothetical protein